MESLLDITKDPTYLEIFSNRHILKIKLRLLELVSETRKIIFTYKIVDTEATDHNGAKHLKGCPDLLLTGDEDVCGLWCECMQIKNNMNKINFFLEEIRYS